MQTHTRNNNSRKSEEINVINIKISIKKSKHVGGAKIN